MRFAYSIFLLFLASSVCGQVNFAKKIEIEGKNCSANVLVRDESGNYYIGGIQYTDPYKPVIIKITQDGDIKWIKRFNIHGGVNILSKTSDNNFIAIIAQSIIAKLDTNLNILWSFNLNGGINASFIESLDKQLLFLFEVSPFGEPVNILAKFTPDAKLLWSTIFVGVGQFNISCGGIYQLPDSSIVLGGGIQSGFSMMKFSSEGREIWSKHYSTDSSNLALSIPKLIHLHDGKFLTYGTIIESSGFPTDAENFLMKLDSNGDKLWNTSINGLSQETLLSLIETDSKGFIGTGFSKDSSALYMISTDSIGGINTLSISHIPRITESGQTCMEISENNIALLGVISLNGNNQYISFRSIPKNFQSCFFNLGLATSRTIDLNEVASEYHERPAYYYKVDTIPLSTIAVSDYNATDICNLAVNEEMIDTSSSISVSPNPMHSDNTLRIDATSIEIGNYYTGIYDILGNEVFHAELAVSGDKLLNIKIPTIRPGVYTVDLQKEKKSNTHYHCAFIME
jgi:hypothetical protein